MTWPVVSETTEVLDLACFSPMLELSLLLACTAKPCYLEQVSALNKKQSRGEAASPRRRSLLYSPPHQEEEPCQRLPWSHVVSEDTSVTMPNTCCLSSVEVTVQRFSQPQLKVFTLFTLPPCASVGRKVRGKKLVQDENLWVVPPRTDYEVLFLYKYLLPVVVCNMVLFCSQAGPKHLDSSYHPALSTLPSIWSFRHRTLR